MRLPSTKRRRVETRWKINARWLLLWLSSVVCEGVLSVVGKRNFGGARVSETYERFESVLQITLLTSPTKEM